MSGRENQRTRTRAALMQAAGDLLREGQPPSMAAAADRALVSVATAYRYFSSPQKLWEDAAAFDNHHLVDEAETTRQLDAAGDDVAARVEIVIRRHGWALVDHQAFARRAAKTSLDRWLDQHDRAEQPEPIRPGQRNHWNAIAVEPLRRTYPDEQVDALVEALGVCWGVEAVITLSDVLELDGDAAKERMLTTARWILRGGLAAFADEGKQTD